MNTSGNFCLKCGCEFLDKKRKKNITGEFGKIYQAVFNENLSENDALPRAVCASWKYQIEKAWQQSRKAEEQSIQYLSLLKRKHPQSPLSSSCGDEQTVTRIERKKKGHRLVFEANCPEQMLVTANTHPAKECAYKLFYQSYSHHLQRRLMHVSVNCHQPYVRSEKYIMLLRKLQNQAVIASQVQKKVHVLR